MFALTPDEQSLLAQGVSQWGGPAQPSHALALALGVDSVEALIEEGYRIAGKLDNGEPLTDHEVVFAAVSTELNFASDRWGAGVEWSTVSGFTDSETISRLRNLQRRLVGVGPRPWP